MSVYECKQQKSFLGVALDLLNDGCPDETRMQLCGMENMDEAGRIHATPVGSISFSM